MNTTAKYAIIAGLFSLAAGFGVMADPPPQAVPPGGGKPIKVQVEMISLPVVVTTGRGEYVTDLKKEDFAVVDNGKNQKIAGFATVEEPISVALVLDSSDSTRPYADILQNEAIRFVSFLKKDDGLAILSFADDVVLWESFSLYKKKNPMVIRQLDHRGLSAVYEGVWLALEQVLKHEFGKKALLLFSDGVDTRSQTVTKEETLDLARRTEATIYCICYHPGKGRSGLFPVPGGGGNTRADVKPDLDYLEKLARYSGGTLVEAKKIDDLSYAFRKISRELSSQYSIGYYPNNLQRKGEFHNVEVRLKKPGLTARTKQGYYAPNE
ncbi:MAG: VWA domain-containing protein [Acidobacteria bacterium]|nr:VWA domain-containing protein [Acidobacteriota bacterium]